GRTAIPYRMEILFWGAKWVLVIVGGGLVLYLMFRFFNSRVLLGVSIIAGIRRIFSFVSKQPPSPPQEESSMSTAGERVPPGKVQPSSVDKTSPLPVPKVPKQSLPW